MTTVLLGTVRSIIVWVVSLARGVGLVIFTGAGGTDPSHSHSHRKRKFGGQEKETKKKKKWRDDVLPSAFTSSPSSSAVSPPHPAQPERHLHFLVERTRTLPQEPSSTALPSKLAPAAPARPGPGLGFGDMKHQPPPPPRRWGVVAAVVALVLLACLQIQYQHLKVARPPSLPPPSPPVFPFLALALPFPFIISSPPAAHLYCSVLPYLITFRWISARLALPLPHKRITRSAAAIAFAGEPPGTGRQPPAPTPCRAGLSSATLTCPSARSGRTTLLPPARYYYSLSGSGSGSSSGWWLLTHCCYQFMLRSLARDELLLLAKLLLFLDVCGRVTAFTALTVHARNRHFFTPY